MSDPLFDEDDEANTPLEAEEREQLIPSYITLRRELNEAEQINITDAAKWIASRKRDVLDELFKSLLHKLMTGEIRVADLDLSALEKSTSAGATA